MKKYQKLILLQLALTLADFILTYRGTPDLELEANPLVMHFGVGWNVLILSNILFMAVYIPLVWYAFAVYKSPLIHYTKYTEFISMLCYDRPDKFGWTVTKVPKNWVKLFGAMLGYAAGYTLPLCRIIIVAEWAVYLKSPDLFHKYDDIREKFPFKRIDTAAAMVLFVFLAIWWTYRECKINRIKLDKIIN